VSDFKNHGISVYKVGNSESLFRRHGQYPNGSEILYFLQCDIAHLFPIETQIKYALRTHPSVKLRREFGTEFFEGDLNVIKAVFLETFVQYHSSTDNVTKDAKETCSRVELREDRKNQTLSKKTLVMDPDQIINDALASNPELYGRVRFCPEAKVSNSSGLFHCNPTTNIWKQRHNIVFEVMIMDAIKNNIGFNMTKNQHVFTKRGRSDMVHLLASKVVDENFRTKLDSNPDIFALDNGCFCFDGEEATKPVFRPLRLEDSVSISTGWSYSKEEAVAARPKLEEFLAQVLPDPEERRVTLAYFASLMSGRRKAKKILVLTDRRSGNNGKSTLIGLFTRFFGEYAESNKGTKFVCKGSYDKDLDSHDAGLEPFRGKRLVVAEELKGNMTLDIATLKRVVGGANINVGGRCFGSNTSFSFSWQAGIVLIFQKDIPKFDQEDAAFGDRLLFTPMRSKFLRDASSHKEPLTFEIDPSISMRFPGWLSALADILVEHIGTMGVFLSLPQSMMSWRDDVTNEANPAAQWCETNLIVTGSSKDYVILGELEAGIRNFVNLAKAFYTGVRGASYCAKTSVIIGGKYVTKRNVLRGVKFAS
jgi:phage/plasmid-associated DNA primase